MAIEIDGNSHIGKEFKDIYRTAKIGSHNIYVLRFPDHYVKQAMEIVLNKLNEYIDRFENGTLKEFNDYEI